MLTHNQAQSMFKVSPKIIFRILVVIVCVLSAILISLVDLRTKINSLTIELMSDQERSFRLYYDTGSGYNEQESVDGEVLRRDKKATTYHFPIPHDKTLITIRIDPGHRLFGRTTPKSGKGGMVGGMLIEGETKKLLGSWFPFP